MGTKLGLVSPAMYADQAVLIPELLEGLPFGVFATSSIDALVHAVESSLSPKATPYTKLFGYKAIEMLIRGYQRIAMDGQESRIGLLEDFLLASNYAGLAFGTARLRRGSRHQLSVGRQISRATWREQLCDVYRGAEKLHGTQAGWGDCGAEPLSG